MKDVCIVGLGPAGFGALSSIAQSDIASGTVCIEAGVGISDKKCQLAEGEPCANEDPCEIISGVGGCSCTTGAKLSGYPAGGGLVQIVGSTEKTKDNLEKSLSTLRSLLTLQEVTMNNTISKTKIFFQKLGFAYRPYPVYTFNHKDLSMMYNQILSSAEFAGVKVLLKTKVIDISKVDQHYRLLLSQGSKQFEIETKYVVLAVGAHGQELIQNVESQLNLSTKGYHLDVGVRIEFPSKLFPDIDKYHGDLKLLFRNARTFCICKGGKITPYRNHGIFALEGSLRKGEDSGFTNLAITIRQKILPENIKIFNNIIANVRSESGGIPVSQTLPEYINCLDCADSPRTPSSFGLWKNGKIDNFFPSGISKELKEAVQFFASRLLPKDSWDQVNIFAPELDFRVVFPLQKDFSIAPKLYLIGECTGRFRGILQAFCSGQICANNILTNQKETLQSE